MVDYDIETILNNFGKLADNEEVIQQIDDLAIIHKIKPTEFVDLLMKYLNTEKISDESISLDLLDRFEKHLESSKIEKQSKSRLIADTSFLGQYLTDSNDLSIIDQQSMEVDDDNVIDEIGAMTSEWPIDICLGQSVNIGDYLVMYQRNRDVSDVLDRHDWNNCKNQLRLWNETNAIDKDRTDRLKLSDLSLVGELSHLEDVWIAGRISLDHSQIHRTIEMALESIESGNWDKLSETNIALQGYSEQRAALESLSFDDSISYSVFPGANIIVKGKNPTRNGFTVTEILPKFINPCPIIPDERIGDLRVTIATGPFGDNYQSIIDKLVARIKADRSHVLIMIGPIIIDNADSQTDQIRPDQDRLVERLSYLAKSCVEIKTRLIVVPGLEDPTEIPVYPQPPFDRLESDMPEILRTNPLVDFLPNPAALFIGPYKFCLSSVDVLRHMSANEISRGRNDNRIERLCHHILAESHFYPLRPAHPEVSIDWPLYDARCRSLFDRESPHCLILPSKLNAFVKNVSGVVCINPGFINRDSHLSTFCQLTIFDNNDVNRENSMNTNNGNINSISDRIDHKIITL